MNVTDEFVNWLNQALRDRGWSQTELARRADGVSRSLVNLVLSAKQPPSFDFCAAIARPLGKRPEELFRMAGLLPSIRSDGGEISEQEFLELLPLLSPEERRNLRQYAEFLISQKRAGEEAGGQTATAPGD